MSTALSIGHKGNRSGRLAFAALFVAMLLLTSPLPGQQTYVTRYDLFLGATYLNSPQISLAETGFHLQTGFRPKTWVSVGFDYSIATGDLTLTPDLLTTDLQHSLGAQLAQLAAAGRLPAGYSLVAKAHSRTQTFTVGPQLAYRRWKAVTLFFRPTAGLIREVAQPILPDNDPIARAIITQLAPSGEKKDWAIFYGFGGGIDFNFTPHFALRVQSDLVRDHLFPDLIQNSRGTVRFSVGPAFNFGPNIISQ